MVGATRRLKTSAKVPWQVTVAEVGADDTTVSGDKWTYTSGADDIVRVLQTCRNAGAAKSRKQKAPAPTALC